MRYNKLNKTKETKQKEREVQSIENIAYYLKQNLSKGGTVHRNSYTTSQKILINKVTHSIQKIQHNIHEFHYGK